MNELLLQTFFVALATSTVSVTIAKSGIFKPMRDTLAEVPFVGKMISCFYCVSHWVALFFTLFLIPVDVTANGKTIDFFILVLATISLSTFISIGMIKAIQYSQIDPSEKKVLGKDY